MSAADTDTWEGFSASSGNPEKQPWTMITIALIAIAAVMFVCICVMACVMGRYFYARLTLGKVKKSRSRTASPTFSERPLDLESQIAPTSLDFSNHYSENQAGEGALASKEPFDNDLHLLRAQMDFVRIQYQPDESEEREHSVSRNGGSEPVSRPDSPFFMSSWASTPYSNPSCLGINYVGSEAGSPVLYSSSPSSTTPEQLSQSLPMVAVSALLRNESTPVAIATQKMVVRQLESAMRSSGPNAIMELGSAIEDVLTVGGMTYEDDIVKEALGVLRGLMSAVPNPVVSPRRAGDL